MKLLEVYEKMRLRVFAKVFEFYEDLNEFDMN